MADNAAILFIKQASFRNLGNAGIIKNYMERNNFIEKDIILNEKGENSYQKLYKYKGKIFLNLYILKYIYNSYVPKTVESHLKIVFGKWIA